LLLPLLVRFQIALFQLEKLGGALIFVDVVVVCKNAFAVNGALFGAFCGCCGQLVDWAGSGGILGAEAFNLQL